MLDDVADRLERYSHQPQLNGPRMRLGLAWFLLILLGVAAGAWYVGIVFGLVAFVAAVQTSRAWTSAGQPASALVAGVGALLLPIATAFGVRMVGVIFILFAIAAVFFDEKMRFDTSILETDSREEALTRAASTLRCGLLVGAASAAIVQVYKYDVMFFMFLLAACCIYDLGDFLYGGGYDNRLVGPVAGGIGIVMVSGLMYLISPSPIDGFAAIVMGFVLLIASPVGQLLASAILPRARSFAPGLRRIDSWLLSAPLFLIGLWIVGS